VTPARTLLLGLGNPILRDDAVGIRLATDFAERLGLPDGIRPGGDWLQCLRECSLGGITLVETLAGFDRVVVLDSIATRGGVPGTWHTFTAEALKLTLNLNNVHDTNFATALELGRRLGFHLPEDRDIRVFAVEVEDTLTFDASMSPSMEKAYPIFAEEIFDELACWMPELLVGDSSGLVSLEGE
jgi:hydrogenase maturation protease